MRRLFNRTPMRRACLLMLALPCSLYLLQFLMLL